MPTHFPEEKITKGDINELDTSEKIDQVLHSLYVDEDKKDHDAAESSGGMAAETSFAISFLSDWCMSIVIGFLVVSYWRGTWTLLDRWTCQQPATADLLNGENFCFAIDGGRQTVRLRSAYITYVVGYILLLCGLLPMELKLWRPRKKRTTLTPLRAMLRIVTVYILGAATVNIWHGIWYFADYLVLPYAEAIEQSYWTSTMFGIGLCYCMLAGNSLLAPPAIYLLDGPARLPPPLGVTILTTYRSIVNPAPKYQEQDTIHHDSLWVHVLDVFASFIILPIGVVNFWRGLWLVLDFYFWGFSDVASELHFSMLYSAILGMGCLVLASEDLVQYFPTPQYAWEVIMTYSSHHNRRQQQDVNEDTSNHNNSSSDDKDAKKEEEEEPPKPKVSVWIANHIFGRFRTLILAVGCVNFWRVVWYIWDEFIGASSAWSAGVSHAVGWFGLLTMGCMSCISAPPSTLGVDAVAHPQCADEPLFYNVPVATEAVYWFAIARQPTSAMDDDAYQLHLSSLEHVPRPSATYEKTFRQTAAHIESMDRKTATSVRHITKRNALKRIKSQFFRSR